MTSEHDEVQRIVDSVLGGGRSPKVLEAGCGSLSHFHFPEDAHLVGIDIDAAQLDRNKSLHDRIHGDIQTYELPAEGFDAIICWNVLEHLRRPEDALERFARGLRQGGLIILSAPNPLSSKGIVTKLTPFAFHLWFYRNIRGWKEAGRDGNPPFPTHLKLTATPDGIKSFARRNRLTVLYENVFGEGGSKDVIGRKSKTMDIVMYGINLFFRIISLGRLQPELTQYTFVLQKGRPAPEPRPRSGGGN
jgi:SAM-dependent methyltransferase